MKKQLKKSYFGYNDDIGYPLDPSLWEQLSFFIMQVTPALTYNDLYNMPEDTFFSYYFLSLEKQENEMKAYNQENNSNNEFKKEDEDPEAIAFFEELTGYND